MVSTRRNKKNPYAVGDKVEVTRRGAVVAGILLSKHKRQRNDTQWKISLVDSSNIVVKESKLGRIVSLNTTDEHPSLPAATVSGSDVSITTTQQQQQQQLSQSSSLSANTAKPSRSKTISRKELQQAGLTTRQGQTVRKIPMQTGILYIYTTTRRAEFVRTK